MRVGRDSWRIIPTQNIILLLCLCCLALGIFFWPGFKIAQRAQVPTHSTYSSHSPTPHTLAVSLNVGFASYYRSGYWTPIQVTLHNSGSPFHGKLTVRAFSESSDVVPKDALSPWSFEDAVTLASGSRRQVTVYAPYSAGTLPVRGFVANLLDEHNRHIATGWSTAGNEVRPGDLFIGLLTEQTSDFSVLADPSLSLPNQVTPPALYTFDTTTLPDIEEVLENFDVLILENFPTERLRPAQLAALRTWVNRGGVLLEIGGPHGIQTLSSLPTDLLPVTLSGTAQLSPQSQLLPVRGPTPEEFSSFYASSLPPFTEAIPVSKASIYTHEPFSSIRTVLATHDNPLLVKAQQGAGLICYLGFDPTLAPLNDWAGLTTLWQTLFYQTLGDRLLISDIAQNFDSGPGQVLTRGGLLNLLTPEKPSGPNVLGILLLTYLLALIAIGLLLKYRVRRPYLWQWRLVLLSTLLFSFLAYGTASYQKTVSLTNNSISLLQLNQGDSSAHMTTFMGLFMPNEGDFTVHLAGKGLIQPLSRQFLPKNTTTGLKDDEPTAIQANVHEMDLTLHNSHIWTLHPLITEQEARISGTISTHLELIEGHLVGTVTNTLASAINDAYVLLPHAFVPLGHIAAQQTLRVDLLLHSAAANAGKTLADQIAEYHHLPAPYFPYTGNANGQTQPLNETQQHVALLSALSGTGYDYAPCSGSCLTHAILNKGMIYTTGGQVPNPNLKNDYDPLLLPRASATLVGWTDTHDTQLGDVATPTVNGVQPQGQHTTFLQMPLNIDLSNLPQVPLDFITGRLIDIQSPDAQAILAGVYSLSEGNLTFELPLPDTSHRYIHNMTIHVPDLIAHPFGPQQDTPTHHSNIGVQLYNWQKATWESMPMQDDAYNLSLPTPYVDATNRILVLVSSNDTNQIYFSKPSLSMNSLNAP